MQRTPFNPHSPTGKDSSCSYVHLCVKATPSVPVRRGLSESMEHPCRGAGQPRKSSAPGPAREPSPGCVGPDRGQQSRGQWLGDIQELGEGGSPVPRECPRDGLHTRT